MPFVRSLSHVTYPPSYNGSSSVLDKNAFKTSVKLLAVDCSTQKTGLFLRSDPAKRMVLDLPRIKTVVSHPSDPQRRLVLLRVDSEADLSPEILEFIYKESKGVRNYSLELDYDYWTADQILHSFLPDHLKEGSPSGFAITGHIAHLNLNDEYVPYKHIIGQVVLEKNHNVRTVVRKLDTIDNKFRFFKMEVIAGDPDFIVTHHESECQFTFDFSQVYWNSRLSTEHSRLVSLFSPEDVVADVFAGVGPFAIPSGKRGSGVLANDLNPTSYVYLKQNIRDNKMSGLVRPFCEDGRDFITKAPSRIASEPFPSYVDPKAKKLAEKGKKSPSRLQSLRKMDSAPLRKYISHFVMNLPDSSITFLDAFRGILSDENLRDIYPQMPMVHCYAFTRELDEDLARIDLIQRMEEILGHSILEIVDVHLVRAVAPNKQMYCISFRLPIEVATA